MTGGKSTMSEKSMERREFGDLIKREEILNNPNNLSDSNKAWISGFIEEDFEYSHESFGERFYKTRVRVTRNSGTEDFVPIVVSDWRVTNISEIKLKGKYVEIGGQFRSDKRMGEDGKKHLYLCLFVTDISVCEDGKEPKETTDENSIYLDGYICKTPVFRITPLEKEITDLLVAVHRNYPKTDFIPCIAWGESARFASQLKVGDRIKLFGRIQSREYFKKLSPESEEGETRTVYEVSIMRMAKVEKLLLEE